MADSFSGSLLTATESYNVSRVISILSWKGSALFHAGWAKDNMGTEPVSGLIVTRSRIEKPLISCFCVTSRLIYRLYKTIKKGIYINRVAFNSPTNWWDSKRYDLLDNRTTADRLLERFYSEKLEKFIKSRLNNHL